MNTVTRYWQWVSLIVETQLNVAGIRTRDERGAVSSEMAVVLAAMVAIAVAAAIIFMSKAISNANNIPDTVNPPT